MLEPRLNAQKATLERENFRVKVELAAEPPKIAINRIAAERDFSLLVVGSQGHAMSSEIRLRGVASEVIHNARIPVLLTRLAVPTMKDESRCNVVCPTLLDHILARAQKGDISLVVMGSQGRGFVGEVFLGSVSHQVARRRGSKVKILHAGVQAVSGPMHDAWMRSALTPMKEIANEDSSV